MGLDCDGHKPLTAEHNSILADGSEETHEEMTEQATKINEKLAAKGKQPEDVSHDESDEITHSVGLRRHEPKWDLLAASAKGSCVECASIC